MTVVAARRALALLVAAWVACASAQELPEASPDEAFDGPVLPVAAPVAVDEVTEPVATGTVTTELDRGLASWYGPRFHGRRTASGERFDMHALTAAHRSLPFGTVVRVESLVNGRSVDVRINDRGPHIKRRIIDLSRAAAHALGLIDAGTGTKRVVLKVVKPTE